jgi:hypothetical protein
MLGRYIAANIAAVLSALAIIVFLIVIDGGGDFGIAVLVAGSVALLAQVVVLRCG